MLVFIDFDGVLRPLAAPPRAFEPRCLQAFEAVVRERPQARLVVSSSWRLGLGLGELRALFSADIGPRVCGVTPALAHAPRHGRFHEVMIYLEQVSARLGRRPHWVAVDDDAWHYPRELLGRKVLLTDPLEGFDAPAAGELRRMLEPPAGTPREA